MIPGFDVNRATDDGQQPDFDHSVSLPALRDLLDAVAPQLDEINCPLGSLFATELAEILDQRLGDGRR